MKRAFSGFKNSNHVFAASPHPQRLSPCQLLPVTCPAPLRPLSLKTPFHLWLRAPLDPPGINNNSHLGPDASMHTHTHTSPLDPFACAAAPSLSPSSFSLPPVPCLQFFLHALLFTLFIPRPAPAPTHPFGQRPWHSCLPPSPAKGRPPACLPAAVRAGSAPLVCITSCPLQHPLPL